MIKLFLLLSSMYTMFVNDLYKPTASYKLLNYVKMIKFDSASVATHRFVKDRRVYQRICRPIISYLCFFYNTYKANKA